MSAHALSRLIERCQPSHSPSTAVLQTPANGPGKSLENRITLTLSVDSWEELSWWDNQMIKWNGKTILTTEPDLIIESDASNQGWGASCQGTNTGGPWSIQEKTRHINCLELLAATLALTSIYF